MAPVKPVFEDNKVNKHEATRTDRATRYTLSLQALHVVYEAPTWFWANSVAGRFTRQTLHWIVGLQYISSSISTVKVLRTVKLRVTDYYRLRVAGSGLRVVDGVVLLIHDK